MERSDLPPVLFILLGVLGSLFAIVWARPEYAPLDVGQPEFAVVLILVTSAGFLATGLLWIIELDSSGARHRQVPGLTLSLLGVLGITGSVVVMNPGAHDGLAGGLRGMAVIIAVLVGIPLLLGGWHWRRNREMRYPLSILAGSLALGLFYLVHQRLDLLVPIPRLAIVVGVVVAAPAIAVLYGLPRHLSTS